MDRLVLEGVPGSRGHTGLTSLPVVSSRCHNVTLAGSAGRTRTPLPWDGAAVIWTGRGAAGATDRTSAASGVAV